MLAMFADHLESAFFPLSIAVVGASGSSASYGYIFIYSLVDCGYPGRIYPINPNESEVLGFKTYPALKDVPGLVEYVICCLSASKVLDLLSQCKQKGVKFIHLFTGRFSETGLEEAVELEKEILCQARKLGIRLIGPNCMGIYCPKGGMSFGYDFPKEPGKVGMFLQSGGASTEFVRYAALRGIRFSKVISYGNALDLDETDFLQYLAKDSETEVIACYVEGVKDGRRFFNALHQAASLKPIIILKAGRSSAGTRAASSHTAALAGTLKIWESAIKQTGTIQARSLDEMMDLVVAFCSLPPLMGTRVGIVGGGGGKSVLSADEWEEAGLRVVPLTPEIREEIKRRVPEMWWGWIGNPVDVSIMPEEAWVTDLSGDILRIMAGSSNFDLLVANVTVDAPFEKAEMTSFIRRQVEVIIEIKRKGTKPLAVVLNTGALGVEDFKSWRWKLFAEQKSRLVAAGLPVYPAVGRAAEAICHVANYYRRRNRQAEF